MSTVVRILGDGSTVVDVIEGEGKREPLPRRGRPRGRCVQCGKDCALEADGRPVAHKSGNPDDWYARRELWGPPKWCTGEQHQALGLEERWP